MHRTQSHHSALRTALVGCGVAAALITASTAARAEVSAEINLRVGSQPAPVVVFEREPEVILVPRTNVYYVQEAPYDLYRYGRYWYINDGGFWFRASSYRGPFVSIGVSVVPRTIVTVPARYRRHPTHPHGGPPGQMKKQNVVVMEDDWDDSQVRVIKGGKVEKKGKGKGHD